jgi:hypothetical protein
MKHLVPDVKRQNKAIEKLQKEFDARRKELLSIEPFRKGSIMKRWQTCKKDSCRCKTDKKYRHWPYYSWTTKEKNKTVCVIVPEALLAEANVYIHNDKQIRTTINKLAKLSDKIFRKKIEFIRNSASKKAS